MNFFDKKLAGVKTVAITGHIRPDGDCVGSCLAVYNYLEENYPRIQAFVYLEPPSSKFAYLKNVDRIVTDCSKDREHDLCICLDCGDLLRLGEAVKFFHSARESLLVDHHVTNSRYAGENVVEERASSTCEVVYSLFEEEKVSKAVAECIYTGIVHDTGVFKYDCTSAKTMEIAGKMMAKGVDFPKIIDDSFYSRSFLQTRVLGKILSKSVLCLEGRCIYSALTREEMENYGISQGEMEGMIDQLRVTQGVECAVFLYETEPGRLKVSMRSTKDVDVSKIALIFGGGGHKKAAGCAAEGTVQDVMERLSAQIAGQLT